MKSKPSPFLYLILLFLAVLFIFKWKNLKQIDNPASTRSLRFQRNLRTLQYTRHALCRMDCRHITQTDIEDIMRRGDINYAKSDVEDKPCPTYALQGYTTDGQYLRVIFAQCDQQTKVVTCYDLQHEFECHCPGDEKKKAHQ